MSGGQIKLLYIAGRGHSGSTILSRVLAAAPGIITVGEIAVAWYRAAQSMPFRSDTHPTFQFWYEVFEQLRAEFSAAQLAQMAGGVYAGKIRSPLGNAEADRRFFDALARLYQIVQERTGAQVIIDTSKRAAYALYLRRVSTIDLYILHLVRDSRAVLHSYSRLPVHYLSREGHPSLRLTLIGAYRWWQTNLAAEIALQRQNHGRYLRLRYEDFAQHPYSAAAQILQFIGEAKRAQDLPFVSETEVRLPENHHLIQGNKRVILSEGDRMSIQLDNAWRTQLDRRSRFLETVLTFPLMLRYGYFSRRPQPAPSAASPDNLIPESQYPGQEQASF